MTSPHERKTEVTQGTSEAIWKNKGHHQRSLTTYTVSSHDERDPGEVSSQLSSWQTQSWVKKELMRAPVH